MATPAKQLAGPRDFKSPTKLRFDLSLIPQSVDSAQQIAMTCRQALDVVAGALRCGETRHFQIALVGFLIDGRPFPADGLTVSAIATPQFVITPVGFTCDGFFLPAMLDSVNGASVTNMTRPPQGVELVRVKISVEYRDVWAITEFVRRQEHTLFVDPLVILHRKLAFAHEAAEWRQRPSIAH